MSTSLNSAENSVVAKSGITCMFIGDLHYHQKTLEDHKLLAAEIHRSIDVFCAEHGHIDLIVCLGDELDEHDPPADVRGACVRFLRSLKERCDMLVVLVGNHTRKNNRVSRGPDHTLAELSTSSTGVKMVEDPMIINIREVCFLALPYMDPESFDSIAAECVPALVAGGNIFDFVVGHQEIRGAQLRPGHESEDGSHWHPNWPPLISGHIHERSVFNNVLYTGTPMQHSLSETPDKYVYFGQFKKRDSSANTSWSLGNPGQFVTSSGFLQEVKMLTLPIRQKVTVHVNVLPQFMQCVRNNQKDYFNVTVLYDVPTQISLSADFSQLKLMKRIKVKAECTVHPETLQTSVPRPRQLRFEDELFSSATQIDVRNLLIHIKQNAM